MPGTGYPDRFILVLLFCMSKLFLKLIYQKVCGVVYLKKKYFKCMNPVSKSIWQNVSSSICVCYA